MRTEQVFLLVHFSANLRNDMNHAKCRRHYVDRLQIHVIRRSEGKSIVRPWDITFSMGHRNRPKWRSQVGDELLFRRETVRNMFQTLQETKCGNDLKRAILHLLMKYRKLLRRVATRRRWTHNANSLDIRSTTTDIVVNRAPATD